MLISNIFNETDLQLMMDGTVLKIVEIHKHLGVYLSSNNKWSKHIDSIIASASKQISFMRKIRYKFSKQTLNTLNCTYTMRLPVPGHFYSCVVSKYLLRETNFFLLL